MDPNGLFGGEDEKNNLFPYEIWKKPLRLRES